MNEKIHVSKDMMTNDKWTDTIKKNKHICTQEIVDLNWKFQFFRQGYFPHKDIYFPMDFVRNSCGNCYNIRKWEKKNSN